MNTIDVTVSRVIRASAERLYDLWTDPASPGGPWFGVARLLIEVRVDGLFYFAVAHEGRTWAHYGRFVTLERPRTIAYTWMSESTLGLESTVTITLTPRDGGTELTLVHAGVPDDAKGRQHAEGWTWMLSMLVDKFAKDPA